MEEIIKYKNRKLYSRTQKLYITLGDIKTMLKEGKTVTVLDKETGADITDKTLGKVAALTSATAAQFGEFITNN